MLKNIFNIEKHNKNKLLITLITSSLNKQLSIKSYKKHNPEEITSKQKFCILSYKLSSLFFLFKLIEAIIKNLIKFLYLSKYTKN